MIVFYFDFETYFGFICGNVGNHWLLLDRYMLGLGADFLSVLLKFTGHICQCCFASGRVGGTTIPTGSILHIPKVGVDFRGGTQSEC